MDWLGWLKAAFFPPHCLFCGAVVPYGRGCCSRCMQSLPYLNGFLCEKKPAAGDYRGCAAPFLYEEPVRQAILDMKRLEHRENAAVFAPFCARAVAAVFGGVGLDGVVCVPNLETPDRRVYTPARVLARQVARRLALPFYPDALIQCRTKEKQHFLPAGRREENVRGAYAPCEALPGQTLLLVDDVITTGSTMQACAQALREGGASDVYCLAVAATQLYMASPPIPSDKIHPNITSQKAYGDCTPNTNSIEFVPPNFCSCFSTPNTNSIEFVPPNFCSCFSGPNTNSIEFVPPNFCSCFSTPNTNSIE